MTAATGVPAAPLSRREARERRESEQRAANTTGRMRARGKAARRPATALAASVIAQRPTISVRAMVARFTTFSAMVGVAGMLVATSVPANAFFSAPSADVAAQAQAAAPQAEVQSVAVPKEAEAVAAHASVRDNYTVVSLSDQLRSKYGDRTYSFTNNPNGTIQWPFATSVPISSGYGDRAACSYCSSNHQGVDFVPGLGAPIQSIADGVVREVVVAGGALGVHVVIDHVINGQQITSVYAHMLWGSPAVAVGQAVRVGQYLGDVGNTGASTGPHLHLEIHVDGTPVDPFVWLKANAN